MSIPVFQPRKANPLEALHINCELVADWLTRFLYAECATRRGVDKVVLGLSGGVDSAVVAFLAARAFGNENVLALKLPYRVSSEESLVHADIVIDQLGIPSETIEITAMVDGYVSTQTEISPTRVGNVCARCRTAILFDKSAENRSLPLGTGNKTERLLGYYTWHGDDAPPINPLGDLFKTQVWELARFLGVPKVIVDKPPSADLIKGQTDETDIGVPYSVADPILNYLLQGWSSEMIERSGFSKADIDSIHRRLEGTHWKRRPATVAMLSNTAIGEYYLRPVDY